MSVHLDNRARFQIYWQKVRLCAARDSHDLFFSSILRLYSRKRIGEETRFSILFNVMFWYIHVIAIETYLLSLSFSRAKCQPQYNQFTHYTKTYIDSTCACVNRILNIFHYLFFSVLFDIVYVQLKLFCKFQQPWSVCEWNEFKHNLCYRLWPIHEFNWHGNWITYILWTNKLFKLMKRLIVILSQAYYCCTHICDCRSKK